MVSAREGWSICGSDFGGIDPWLPVWSWKLEAANCTLRLGKRRRLHRCRSRIWAVWMARGDMISEDLWGSDKEWMVGGELRSGQEFCATASIGVQCGHTLYKARQRAYDGNFESRKARLKQYSPLRLPMIV